MSHIHLPDGVIPVLWWILGFLVTGGVLAVAFYRTRSTEARRKVPLLGMMAALMLIGQSVPLGFIPFHMNLAVLSGIILGPWLGFIAVFVANVFLALLAHGGVTVVGLNTIVVGSEAVLGYLLFTGLKRVIKSPAITAGVATVTALLVSIVLMVGIVSLINVSPGLLLEETFEETGRGEVQLDISLTRFIAIIAPFAVVGIAIESIVTGLVTRFLLGVRPEIMEGR